MDIYYNKDDGYISVSKAIHSVTSLELTPPRHVDGVGFVRDIVARDSQGVQYTITLFANENSSKEILLSTKQR